MNPLYADVKTELQNAGVTINTIGFGPEAPGALLAQIAADTGGTYRPVATSGLGLLEASSTAEAEAVTALGAPQALTELLAPAATPYLPGQLRLAEVYEDFDTKGQDAARLFHVAHVAVANATWQTQTVQVDPSASVLRFVVAGKQEDDGPLACDRFNRFVEVLSPDPAVWIPISPPTEKIPPPANWSIRNETYNDALVVTDPEPGEWQIRTAYTTLTRGCDNPTVSDFIMMASVQSTIRLQGRLLGLNNGMGLAGDIVPIVATLMTKNGTIRGAVMVATVENAGGTDLVLLLDDGMHHDGGANDGIYGWDYSLTSHGGSYAVRILALFPDPANPSVNLIREWNGGFWIKGPEEDDNIDDDNMPSWWEERFPCLDPRAYDAQGDPDRDGLVSIDEFNRGLNPCRPDTDRGGEMDGSEVKGNRNPLRPNDDRVPPLGRIELRPLDQRVWIKWTRPISYTNMRVFVSRVPGELGDATDMGQTGEFVLGGLTNGLSYYLTLQGQNDDAVGTNDGSYSDQFEIVPKEDPVPPQGAFFIGGPNVENGGDVATSPNVSLFVDATDLLEYEGPASHSVGHSAVSPELIPFINPTNGVEMRFSNDQLTLESMAWEPLNDERPWKLGCRPGEVCVVFGQFRDGAGNESLIVTDEILLQGMDLFLPLVLR